MVSSSFSSVESQVGFADRGCDCERFSVLTHALHPFYKVITVKRSEGLGNWAALSCEF